MSSRTTVLLFFASISLHAAVAQSKCSVDSTPASEADKALWSRRFDDAQRMYDEALTSSPTSTWMMAGKVRVLTAQNKTLDAVTLAKKYLEAHPNDPVLLDALGEARFRRGEVEEAGIAFTNAIKLDPCLGVTYYDRARFLNLSGFHERAQKELNMAHSLSPNEQPVTSLWLRTQQVPETPEQSRVELTARLNDPSLKPEQKQGIEAALKGIDVHEKGSCEAVTTQTSVKLPMVPIQDHSSTEQTAMRGAGLELLFNGKRRRVLIDTGASGLVISGTVAHDLGLVPELNFKVGGIGDKGAAGAYVSHVDDLKIGSMEFKNCMVQVIESNRLELDGLIGTDVFRDFVVTLDTPGREVRLDPLPKRPGDTAEPRLSLETSDEDDDLPQSMSQSAKDRYIAPEMKDWTIAYRSGHFLIFPTLIGDAPMKLFIMDSGAQSSMITPAAAREVSHVSGNTDITVSGIGGTVNKVMEAENVGIQFAHVKQYTRGMLAYNGGFLSSSSGVEISGLIGFPLIRELVISIDYRDNLVKVVFDPKKGFHAR